MMTGMISIINAVMPALLLTRWRHDSSIVLVRHMEDNKLYYHGWLIYFLGNVLLYGLPALSFPLCFLELDIIDHFFVWWMDFLLSGYWSIVYQGMMVFVFLVAAIYVEETETITK